MAGRRTGEDTGTRPYRDDAQHDEVRPCILQYVPTGASAQRPEHVTPGLKCRQHQHLDIRVFVGDPAGGLDAIQAGHLQVHQYDIGPDQGGLFDRIHAIDGLANDLDQEILCEESCQARPEERMIVGDQQTSRRCQRTHGASHSL